MQSQNNLNVPSTRRKLAIILLGIILFAGLLALAINSLVRTDDNTAVPNNQEYTDPWTGEVVSDPENKSPDKFGIPDDVPIFLGIGELIEHGLTSEQITNLETAFYDYKKQHDNQLDEVSIDVDNIVTEHDQTNPEAPFISAFRVKFDRKRIYQARIEYFGITDIRLYLMDPKTNQVIFDSKVIDP